MALVPACKTTATVEKKDGTVETVAAGLNENTVRGLVAASREFAENAKFSVAYTKVVQLCSLVSDGQKELLTLGLAKITPQQPDGMCYLEFTPEGKEFLSGPDVEIKEGADYHQRFTRYTLPVAKMEILRIEHLIQRESQGHGAALADVYFSAVPTKKLPSALMDRLDIRIRHAVATFEKASGNWKLDRFEESRT
jgi:hypothetical protein